LFDINNTIRYTFVWYQQYYTLHFCLISTILYVTLLFDINNQIRHTFVWYQQYYTLHFCLISTILCVTLLFDINNSIRYTFVDFIVINVITYFAFLVWKGGHRGNDHMVVGFTTIYAISAYRHWCCWCVSRSVSNVQHYVIKFVSVLRQVGGFLRVLRFPPTKLTATI
jgi:hypothetical protein